MIPMVDHGNKILIATDSKGLYLYEEGASPSAYRLNIAINDELQAQSVRDLSRAGNKYVMATRKGGVYVLDNDLNFIQKINQENGLPIDQVWFAGTDSQGAIWACLNKGISRIEINTPFTYWAEREGVGKVFDILRYDEKMYLATNQNFKVLDQASNRFVDIKNNIGAGVQTDKLVDGKMNKVTIIIE